MRRSFATTALALALGTSSGTSAAFAAPCGCAASAPISIDAAPARSPATLVADVAWLRALAAGVSDAAARLAKLNADDNAKDAAIASARRAAASAAASAAANGKAATPRARAVAAAGAAASAPAADPPVARSRAQVAWANARFGELRQLSIQESATGLPAVIVEPAFGSARVTVTSGWLNAAQALAGARVLVGDASHACYHRYQEAVGEAFAADSAAERLIDPGPLSRRAVPDFAAFAQRTPECRPLLHRTWPQDRPDTRSAIEAGLVWWIGRSLACQASSWEPPPASAPVAPASSSDRAGELLVAMGLNVADAQPVIALYRAAFREGCPTR